MRGNESCSRFDSFGGGSRLILKLKPMFLRFCAADLAIVEVD
jgi:hypothetical protein